MTKMGRKLSLKVCVADSNMTLGVSRQTVLVCMRPVIIDRPLPIPIPNPHCPPPTRSPIVHCSWPPVCLPRVPHLCPDAGPLLGKSPTVQPGPCATKMQIGGRRASPPPDAAASSLPSLTLPFCRVVGGDEWALTDPAVAFRPLVGRLVSPTCVHCCRPTM